MNSDRANKFLNILDYVSTLTPEQEHLAVQNAADPNLVIVSFSGKKGSGKDTLAIEVRKELERLNPNLRDVASYAFASTVKFEATLIIEAIAEALISKRTPIGPLAVELCYRFNIPVVQMVHIIETMEPVFAANRDSVIPNGWTRTPEVLHILQFLGTEVRQRQDPIYWVRSTMNSVVTNTIAGQSTFITDTRFTHEEAAVRAIGAFNVRVDIDPEVQVRRLSSRDGIQISREALAHSSELHLDYSPAFDFRLDNSSDGGLNEKAASIIAALGL